MSEITIDDIYALFQASQAELREELRLSRIESDRLAAERAAERAADDERRRVEDERRRIEEERRRADDERRRVEEEQRRIAAEKSMEELKRTVAQTSREVANLTTRWGRFVEELVRPAVIRLFQGRGINIKQTGLHVKSEIVRMEIDVLGVDGDCVVAVECKSRLSQDDVDEMCQRLSKFKLAFPQYANYQIYGAVAGIEINDTVDVYAYRKGLYVIRTAGDSVEIANDEKFQPTAW